MQKIGIISSQSFISKIQKYRTISDFQTIELGEVCVRSNCCNGIGDDPSINWHRFYDLVGVSAVDGKVR